MAIELQTNDSQLGKANGTLSVTGNSGSSVPRSAGSFGEVLTTQAALFKMDDGRQGLNTAKLLSPDVAHANQLLNQSKTYSDSNAKSIQTFETNIHQAEYILAMKNVAEYKQASSSTSSLSVVSKLAQNISGVGVSGLMHSATGSTGSVHQRTTNPLNQKLDQAIFQVLRNTANDADEAEPLAKGEDFSPAGFFNHSSNQGNSQQHAQDSDAPSPEELQAMGVITAASGQHVIQDMTSSTSTAIQLQMQSSMSSPQWIAELAQKTVVMFGSDKHTAVITLNSADKGSLKIIIHVNGDHVNASFYSNDSHILQALQMGIDDLKASMLEGGLVLNQLNVGPDSSYHQSELAVKGEPSAFDSKLDGLDLHSAKMVNFYV
ncbi:flagellar hook-length control protein FliK [Polynucleobacter sp. UK-Mo-2m-Kol15]|uniref:flagellar hook-length control protein FliK n=1 Tax=Polynucleobacter sp. UK-Mo-2m-Kol15 TaxID=2576916 RepID=UPI001C0B1AE3|nr:flagellar hook-length control protein FliK [Polynucleobacter sp. UK-Mo-2m-Kol15]MBU3575939.1 flagellar hook-length control protein FliK [Polynucleobacter sp. UK-Mo-2m-Kol15]